MGEITKLMVIVMRLWVGADKTNKINNLLIR